MKFTNIGYVASMNKKKVRKQRNRQKPQIWKPKEEQHGNQRIG